MKIIVIGNGFDLNLGLKTSYKDFIESDYFNTLIEQNNSLATYLMAKSNLNNWVDIEKEITQYSMDIQHTDANVKNDFEALKISLANYLKEAQEGEIDQESQAFKMIQEEIQSTDKIYNFNYTNTVLKIAKLLDATDIDIKHSYVHGSIENMDIIFGVEDNARIHQNHIFLKKSYNKNYGETDIGKFLKDENDLVIFGHSLGITDSSYFKNNILSLTFGTKSIQIKFYHYGDIGYDEMMIILDHYTNNNLTEFKHYNNFIPIDSSKK
jgi:hypothetical protein